MGRCRLHATAFTRWWDAIDMTDGTRRVVRVGMPVADGVQWERDESTIGVAWSPPLDWTLADLWPLPGEPPLAGDPALIAGVAVAGIRAIAGGRLRDADNLESRLVSFGGRWFLLGGDDGDANLGIVALAALLLDLDPDDPLGLAGLLASAERGDLTPFVLRALATWLAGERHAIARRAAADRKHDALAALRALAHRLAHALPPPNAYGSTYVSVGGVVKANGDVWSAGRLEPRRARALARALVREPTALPLRRWLVAMCRLRVDRELLARRLAPGAPPP